MAIIRSINWLAISTGKDSHGVEPGDGYIPAACSYCGGEHGPLSSQIVQFVEVGNRGRWFFLHRGCAMELGIKLMEEAKKQKDFD